MPLVAELSKEEREAEERFRVMAFHVAYDAVFANVKDLNVRFGYAIAYSARKIQNRELLRLWWQWTGGKCIKYLLDEGKEAPAELRPIIEAYLKALQKRAQQTGDEFGDLIHADGL